MNRMRRRWTGLAVAVLAVAATRASGYVSAFPNIDDFKDGLDVNAYLGATQFYDAGFTGSSAVVANVEAGLIWSGHESLGHVARNVVGMNANGAIDRHATWVGLVLAGRPTAGGGEYQRGIAHGATLWSGAIATNWVGNPFTRAFNYSVTSLVTGYRGVMFDADAAGRTADVINSSYSDGSDPEAARYGDYSRAIDAMALLSGKVVVCSGGNNGPSGVSGAPGSGFNVIAVGSLGNDLDLVPYDRVSTFSSRGPQAIYIPSISRPIYGTAGHGTVIPAARGVIDILAPGENIVTAFYTGTTGGNAGGLDPTPGQNDRYTNGISGSSFATPSVAGGATLVVDAARQSFGANTRATDGRAVKAILLNSADKNASWSNGQTTINGVITTTQALDFAAGAGRMNLGKAYDQLLAGTTDVSGEVGGTVAAIGWDVSTVDEGVPNDYAITGMLSQGLTLTATLAWFVDRTIDFAAVTDADDNAATAEVSFDDLTLQIWRGTNTPMLVAESRSAYNEVEHLHFALPTTDAYTLRVLWAGEVWDLVGDDNRTTYGLSWAVVPEPASAFVLLTITATTRRRRPRGR